MKSLPLILYITFWLVLIADCILIIEGAWTYRYFTKGLLIPVLLILFFVQTHSTRHKRSRVIIALALLLSWAGDVLLCNNEEDYNFTGGLIAFLAAHIFYTTYFTRIAPFRQKGALINFIAGVFITGFTLVLLDILWSKIDALKGPVTFYAVTLSYMFLRAINTVNSSKLKQKAVQFYIPGAIFFVISDASLALDKYYIHDTSAGLFIIITYSIAQFLLVTGAISYIKR